MVLGRRTVVRILEGGEVLRQRVVDAQPFGEELAEELADTDEDLGVVQRRALEAGAFEAFCDRGDEDLEVGR